MPVITFDNPDALIPPKDFAAHRHTSVGALAHERFRGAGPRFVKIGHRVMYRAGDIAEWIASRTVTPGSPPTQRD